MRGRGYFAARRLALACGCALLAACFAPTGTSAQTSNPVLIGTDGTVRHHNAYVINLRFATGGKVTSIPAGTYTFVIHDYSKIHNFALGSQTQNVRLFTTGIRWRGTKRYTLDLTPGTYAYACSAHFQTMNGTFVVTGT